MDQKYNGCLLGGAILLALCAVVSAFVGGYALGRHQAKPVMLVEQTQEDDPVERKVLPPIKVHFSPKGGCTETVVQAIATAKKNIIVQAYSFTSDQIEQALIQAKSRGVLVRVIIDRASADMQGAASPGLSHAGIEVRLDGRHPIAHNKVMVVDDSVVVTGSFNFTKQAEIGNAENLLVISDPKLAAEYAENWKVHYQHSEAYKKD